MPFGNEPDEAVLRKLAQAAMGNGEGGALLPSPPRCVCLRVWRASGDAALLVDLVADTTVFRFFLAARRMWRSCSSSA